MKKILNEVCTYELHGAPLITMGQRIGSIRDDGSNRRTTQRGGTFKAHSVKGAGGLQTVNWNFVHTKVIGDIERSSDLFVHTDVDEKVYEVEGLELIEQGHE
jgi:hypothetical protein